MVRGKIKLKIDQSSLRQVIMANQKLILENIVAVVKNEAIPALIDKIMLGYDSLSDRMDTLPEDPTHPANWRDEFFMKLNQDLQNTFTVAGNRVIIRLGEKDFLGYDASGKIGSKDTTPLHWLVYYLEGLAGDWGFIGPEVYEKLRGGGSFNSDWGRFGQGFMISREDYQREGWDKVVPFDQVRHPFSGYSPLDIFKEALDEWNIRPYIQKALDAAVQGRKL